MRLRYRHAHAAPVEKSPQRHAAQKLMPPIPDNGLDQAAVHTVANSIAQSNELAMINWPRSWRSNRQIQVEQERVHEEINGTKQERPWNFFFGPTGGFGNVETKRNQIGSDYWTAGALASFNYVFSQFGLGLFADYERIQADVHKHWGDYHIDQAHSCAYATYSPDALPKLAIHSIVGGGYEWYHIDRNTPEGKAKAKTHGAEFDALLTGEYVFTPTKGLAIIPRAGAQYAYLEADGYKEHGAEAFDLKIHRRNAKSLRSYPGPLDKVYLGVDQL